MDADGFDAGFEVFTTCQFASHLLQNTFWQNSAQEGLRRSCNHYYRCCANSATVQFCFKTWVSLLSRAATNTQTSEPIRHSLYFISTPLVTTIATRQRHAISPLGDHLSVSVLSHPICPIPEQVMVREIATEVRYTERMRK